MRTLTRFADTFLRDFYETCQDRRRCYKLFAPGQACSVIPSALDCILGMGEHLAVWYWLAPQDREINREDEISIASRLRTTFLMAGGLVTLTFLVKVGWRS